MGVFSSLNQYERENNHEKILAGIEWAKALAQHLDRPGMMRKKAAKALAKGWSVVQSVLLTGISRASVKKYRRAFANA